MRCLTFLESSGGSVLITGSDDKTVRLWNPKKGLRSELLGTTAVNTLALWPRSVTVVIGSGLDAAHPEPERANPQPHLARPEHPGVVAGIHPG